MSVDQDVLTKAVALRPIILGGAFGNLIEWYDWTIYGLLAPVFAAQIVPASNPATSLIGVLLAYAVGFLMRPLGSIMQKTCQLGASSAE